MKLLKLVILAATASAELVAGHPSNDTIEAVPTREAIDPVDPVDALDADYDENGERGKYSNNKNPYEQPNPNVCGNVKVSNKNGLKFKCKLGRKGQVCKVKCNKAAKNNYTPRKISCVKNR